MTDGRDHTTGDQGLIGRAAEVEQLEDLLVTGVVLSAVGPGGVGKTRLVSEVAERRRQAGQPVRTGLLVDLPPGAEPDAVADALGFESTDAAAVVLADRPELLVLDNCEHLLEPVRQFVRCRAGLGARVHRARHQSRAARRSRRTGRRRPAARSPPARRCRRRALAGGRSSSSTGPTRPAPSSSRRPDCSPTSASCADGSTACRSRSSWRRPAPGRSPPRTCSPSSTSASICCGGRGSTATATTACAPPSRSRPRCWARRSAPSSGAWRCSAARSTSTWPTGWREPPTPASLDSLDLLSSLVDRSLVVAEVSAGATRYRLLELLREHAEIGAAGRRRDRRPRGAFHRHDARRRRPTSSPGPLERWEPTVLAGASAQFTNLVRATELCARPRRRPRPVLPAPGPAVRRHPRRSGPGGPRARVAGC